MPRQKGKPKTGGRRKGTPNKTTAELKALVYSIVSDNLDSVKTNFKKLEPEMQFAYVIKLLPFVLPKQQDTKITVDEEALKALKEAQDKINNMFK